MSAPRGSKTRSEAGVGQRCAKVASKLSSALKGANRISRNSLAVLLGILENPSWLAVKIQPAVYIK